MDNYNCFGRGDYRNGVVHDDGAATVVAGPKFEGEVDMNKTDITKTDITKTDITKTDITKTNTQDEFRRRCCDNRDGSDDRRRNHLERSQHLHKYHFHDMAVRFIPRG